MVCRKRVLTLRSVVAMKRQYRQLETTIRRFIVIGVDEGCKLISAQMRKRRVGVMRQYVVSYS